MSQKGFSQIFITLILIGGIIAGVVLTQKATQFFSKAYQNFSLTEFLSVLGSKKEDQKYIERLDYNQDGVINVIDVLRGRANDATASATPNVTSSPGPTASPTPQPSASSGSKKGDFNNDGVVDEQDYDLLVEKVDNEDYEKIYDLNDDNKLDDDDLDVHFDLWEE